MNNKLITVIVVVVLIIAGVWYFQNKPVADEDKEIIKIGIVAPLTGPGSVFGNALVKGIALAQEDLPKNLKNKYEVIIEDDGSNPGQAANAAQKLINADKVHAIISGTSGTGNAVLPMAEAGKIVHICVLCADKSVGRGDYNFTNSTLPEDEATIWIAEAQRRGYKKIGFISQAHPGINALADAVEKEAKAKNLTVVLKERYDGNNRDFNTIIAKAKQAGAETDFLVAFPPSLDIIGKELKTIGVKNITGAGGSFTIAADTTVFNDQWYTEVAMKDPGFQTRFEKAFPAVRFNVRAAPFAYDSLMILVDGFEKGGSIAANVKALTEYDGKAGDLTKTGNNFRATPGLWVIKDGKPALLK